MKICPVRGDLLLAEKQTRVTEGHDEANIHFPPVLRTHLKMDILRTTSSILEDDVRL